LVQVSLTVIEMWTALYLIMTAAALLGVNIRLQHHVSYGHFDVVQNWIDISDHSRYMAL